MISTPLDTDMVSETETGQRTSTMAQALVRFFAVQHVEMFDQSIQPLLGGILGIFGHANVAGLGEALYSQRRVMPFIQAQSEQSMGYTALAFAKATCGRRLMGVTSSMGAGATNLVTAAAVAHVNHLPVLFLPGDTFSGRRANPMWQQLEGESSFHSSSNECLRPVSRYYARIDRPEQLLEVLPKAVQTLLDPARRGPVTLCLPHDVQCEGFVFPDEFFAPVIHHLFRAEPDRDQLARAAEVLKKAKRPLIIAGGGVHQSGAGKVLEAFAQKHAIPVAETQSGKGCLSYQDALALGGIGVTGTAAANNIARNADVILCVGTRLTDLTTASGGLFCSPDHLFIGLNSASSDAQKLKALPLVADAKRGLEALSFALDFYKSPPSYRERVENEIRSWWGYVKQITSHPEEPPTDAQVIAAVNRTVGENAVVVASSGGVAAELHKLWKTSKSGSYQVNSYACAGSEIAAGIGVKLAYPDREVFVLLGDGSYLMNHSELLTSLQLGLKLNIVLFNNHGHGSMSRLQQNLGMPDFGTLRPESQIDFAANAASYGCQAVQVGTLVGLSDVLAGTKQIKDSCVTVVETDPVLSTPSNVPWNVPVPSESLLEGVRQARVDYERRFPK